MSLAEELLNSVGTINETAIAGTNFIVGTDRFITIPDALKKLGVQYDHNIKTVTFDCPRYCDGHDLSMMRVYINYIRADGTVGSHLCQNIMVDTTDTNMMHFDWTISGHVTYSSGPTTFLVCIRESDSDGNEITHWNSELNTDTFVSPGLRCENVIVEQHPDIISYLLSRMEYIEELITASNT